MKLAAAVASVSFFYGFKIIHSNCYLFRCKGTASYFPPFSKRSQLLLLLGCFPGLIPFKMVSTLQGKNLFLYVKILCFKS